MSARMYVGAARSSDEPNEAPSVTGGSNSAGTCVAGGKAAGGSTRGSMPVKACKRRCEASLALLKRSDEATSSHSTPTPCAERLASSSSGPIRCSSALRLSVTACTSSVSCSEVAATWWERAPCAGEACDEP